jgi:hypothetical protein
MAKDVPPIGELRGYLATLREKEFILIGGVGGQRMIPLNES